MKFYIAAFIACSFYGFVDSITYQDHSELYARKVCAGVMADWKEIEPECKKPKDRSKEWI